MSYSVLSKHDSKRDFAFPEIGIIVLYSFRCDLNRTFGTRPVSTRKHNASYSFNKRAFASALLPSKNNARQLQVMVSPGIFKGIHQSNSLGSSTAER